MGWSLKLILIRHAIAEERSHFAGPGKLDSDRPLTYDGIKKMQKAAVGFSLIHPRLDLLLSSPYKRAKETAEILSEYIQIRETRFSENLTPEKKPDLFLTELLKTLGFDKKTVKRNARSSQKSAIKYRTVAVVGHEPGLTKLLELCILGKGKKFSGDFEFRKGGICSIEFDGLPKPGGGRLEFLIKPSTLRLLSATKMSQR